MYFVFIECSSVELCFIYNYKNVIYDDLFVDDVVN